MEKYTILFSSVDGVGHFNACIGVAEQLRDRGHDVVFATPMSWKGKLAARGFREELYQVSDEAIELQARNSKWGDLVSSTAAILSMPTIDRIEGFLLDLYSEIINQIKYSDGQLKEIVNSVKPDVIVADFVIHVPSLMDQGVPWILSNSISPLGIPGTNVPPSFSGYAIDGDKEEWKTYKATTDTIFKEMVEDFAKWVRENGGPKNLKMNYPYLTTFSPYANMYMYPLELDYTSVRPNPPTWHQFDAFARGGSEIFELPEKLKSGQGKLIYFSLGTIGSSEVNMMKRLLGILAKSPNRFIISKGQRGDELQLSDNMWGDKYLPQPSILPLVDLVITHGGNNTITESFYYGKKVLVLPLLADQLDNAQRVFETGFGLKCDPVKVTEPEFLTAIQTLLDDDMLERRMRQIGMRIRASNSQTRAAELVEKVARNNHKR